METSSGKPAHANGPSQSTTSTTTSSSDAVEDHPSNNGGRGTTDLSKQVEPSSPGERRHEDGSRKDSDDDNHHQAQLGKSQSTGDESMANSLNVSAATAARRMQEDGGVSPAPSSTCASSTRSTTFSDNARNRPFLSPPPSTPQALTSKLSAYEEQKKRLLRYSYETPFLLQRCTRLLERAIEEETGLVTNPNEDGASSSSSSSSSKNCKPKARKGRSSTTGSRGKSQATSASQGSSAASFSLDGSRIIGGQNNKAAYEYAISHVPEIVEMESDMVRFLREENFNIADAAKRFLSYWTYRQRLFATNTGDDNETQASSQDSRASGVVAVGNDDATMIDQEEERIVDAAPSKDDASSHTRAFLPLELDGKGAMTVMDIQELETGFLTMIAFPETISTRASKAASSNPASHQVLIIENDLLSNASNEASRSNLAQVQRHRDRCRFYVLSAASRLDPKGGVKWIRLVSPSSSALSETNLSTLVRVMPVDVESIHVFDLRQDAGEIKRHSIHPDTGPDTLSKICHVHTVSSPAEIVERLNQMIAQAATESSVQSKSNAMVSPLVVAKLVGGTLQLRLRREVDSEETQDYAKWWINERRNLEEAERYDRQRVKDRIQAQQENAQRAEADAKSSRKSARRRRSRKHRRDENDVDNSASKKRRSKSHEHLAGKGLDDEDHKHDQDNVKKESGTKHKKQKQEQEVYEETEDELCFLAASNARLREENAELVNQVRQVLLVRSVCELQFRESLSRFLNTMITQLTAQVISAILTPQQVLPDLPSENGPSNPLGGSLASIVAQEIIEAGIEKISVLCLFQQLLAFPDTQLAMSPSTSQLFAQAQAAIAGMQGAANGARPPEHNEQLADLELQLQLQPQQQALGLQPQQPMGDPQQQPMIPPQQQPVVPQQQALGLQPQQLMEAPQQQPMIPPQQPPAMQQQQPVGAAVGPQPDAEGPVQEGQAALNGIFRVNGEGDVQMFAANREARRQRIVLILLLLMELRKRAPAVDQNPNLPPGAQPPAPPGPPI